MQNPQPPVSTFSRTNLDCQKMCLQENRYLKYIASHHRSPLMLGYFACLLIIFSCNIFHVLHNSHQNNSATAIYFANSLQFVVKMWELLGSFVVVACLMKGRNIEHVQCWALLAFATEAHTAKLCLCDHQLCFLLKHYLSELNSAS